MKSSVRALCGRSVCLAVVAFFGCDTGGDGGEVCRDYGRAGAPSSLWMNLTPIGTAPVGRSGHAAAYDAAGDRLIVHGGLDAAGQVLSDTWVLSHASGFDTAPAWTPVAPQTAPSPPARHGATAIYDPDQDALVLFGGMDASGAPPMDLWVLGPLGGPGAPAWTQRAISGTAPSPRTDMAAAYDAGHDILFLFGGGPVIGGVTMVAIDETWPLRDVMTSPTWVQLSLTGVLPFPCAGAAAAYSPLSDQFVVIGGSGRLNPNNHADAIWATPWTLSNASGEGGPPVWARAHAMNLMSAPVRLELASLVADPTSRRFILFGGYLAKGAPSSTTFLFNNVSCDITEWPSSDWPCWLAELESGLPKPPGRAFHVAAFAPAPANRMIVYGGSLDGGPVASDLWVLRGAGGIAAGAVATTKILADSTVLCVGNRIQLAGVALGPDGKEVDGVIFSWNADGFGQVVSVDDAGLVTAVAAGTATVTAIPSPAGPPAQLQLTVISRPEPKPNDKDCSSDAACSGVCGYGTMVPGSIGEASIGGFCVAGMCKCCYALCGHDPVTGKQTGACECYSCSGNGNCAFDSNLVRYSAEDVCVFE